MDSATFLSLALACSPAVHPGTASALVAVESSFNSNAIGVVGGALQRQPRSKDEALATASALKSAGRNFSLGLAQINVHNLDRFGLSIADALDGCSNLKAMQRVLGECAQRLSRDDAQLNLRRTLSCYYSGNFVTGFRHGYVDRVVAAANRAARDPPPLR